MVVPSARSRWTAPRNAIMPGLGTGRNGPCASAEICEQFLGDLRGCVFDEEVQRVFDGVPGDLGRVDAPKVERVVVEPGEGAVASPERKHRAGDGSPSA